MSASFRVCASPVIKRTGNTAMLALRGITGSVYGPVLPSGCAPRTSVMGARWRSVPTTLRCAVTEARMSTEEAKGTYRQRMQLVVPVFGMIKEQQQAHRFLLRGLPNVAAEWSLLATAFNLRTLWRLWSTTVASTSRWVAEGACSTFRAAHPAVMDSASSLLQLLGLRPQPVQLCGLASR